MRIDVHSQEEWDALKDRDDIKYSDIEIRIVSEKGLWTCYEEMTSVMWG